MKCSTCNQELIQKNAVTLFATGFFMVALAIAFLFIAWLWIISVVLLIIGGYLIVWSTAGKGRWCRHCKKF